MVDKIFKIFTRLQSIIVKIFTRSLGENSFLYNVFLNGYESIILIYNNVLKFFDSFLITNHFQHVKTNALSSEINPHRKNITFDPYLIRRNVLSRIRSIASDYIHINSSKHLSPFLTVYKGQFTSILSIFQRVTAACLLVFGIFVLLLHDQNFYTQPWMMFFYDILILNVDSWFLVYFLFPVLVLFAFFYHYFMGIGRFTRVSAFLSKKSSSFIEQYASFKIISYSSLGFCFFFFFIFIGIYI